MARWCVVLLILFASRPVLAGIDCDTEGDTDVKRLERFAKDKTNEQDGMLGVACGGRPKFKARVAKACEIIIAREGRSSHCYITAAAAGLSTVGTYDVFGWVMARKENPLDWDSGLLAGYYKAELLARIGDPRSAAAIVELWTAADASATRRKQRLTGSWPRRAAAALGVVGGTSEISFLEQQAKATTDKGVAAACRDAIAAIRKRSSAKPT